MKRHEKTKDQPDTSIEVGRKRSDQRVHPIWLASDVHLACLLCHCLGMTGQAKTEAEGVTESTKNSQADVAEPTDPGKTESDAVTIVATEPAEIGTGAEPKPAEAQEAEHGRAWYGRAAN